MANSTKNLTDTLIKMPSLMRSLKDDPLTALDKIEGRFGIKVDKLDPGEMELIVSMSDNELKVLSDLKARAEKLGVAAGDTGNLYY